MKRNKKLMTIMMAFIMSLGIFTMPHFAQAKIIVNKVGHTNITYRNYPQLPNFAYRYGVGKPEGIVIHETADPNKGIEEEINYMIGHYNNAFVHAFADANNIIQIHNTDYGAWGAGPTANQRFIHIELVETNNNNDFVKSVNNQAYYAATMLKKYGLKPVRANLRGEGTVYSHLDVSKTWGEVHHTDPERPYFSNLGYTMDQFFDLVKSYYENDTTQSPNDGLYPVEINPTSFYSNIKNGIQLVNNPGDAQSNGKTFNYATEKKADQKVNYKGEDWYRFGGDGWAKAKELSTLLPETIDEYGAKIVGVNGAITTKEHLRANVYQRDGKIMRSIPGKRLLPATGWYTDRKVTIGHQNYYRISENEWLAERSGVFVAY